MLQSLGRRGPLGICDLWSGNDLNGEFLTVIRQIRLRFGPKPGDPGISINAAPMTVIVGPNNSGKSTLLRDIDLRLANLEHQGRIVEAVEATDPPPEALRDLIVARGRRATAPDGTEQASLARMRPGTTELEEPVSFVLREGRWVATGMPPGPRERSRVAWLFTLLLDGRTRLSIFDNAPGGPVGAPPGHLVAALFQNNAARAQLRNLTREALGEYLVIDPTRMTQFDVRLSERAPASVEEEKGLDAAAVAFHEAARRIGEYSDGVRAYTGLLAAVLSGQFRIILVDEPDAFLHPPLARRLGRTLGHLASTQGATVVAATHDADFVMGAVQSGTGVTVVRLTYRAGIPTARVLEPDRIRALMLDPLLRSTGVLRALFHNAAVVCEADADRAFYEECNERIVATGEDGIPDAVFLNAQNKQTLRRIVPPLREMGIPAVAVADIDILKDGDVLDLARACFVKPDVVATLETRLKAVQTAFEAKHLELAGPGMAKADPEMRQGVYALVRELSEYGLFVVPVGEVEDWLTYLEVRARKRAWLSAVFGAMGTDPAEEGYQRPRADDVWAFLRLIGEWIKDTNRKGMPT